jgi:ABC-type branched-subunit amino acid transport system substrate-binding protein
VGQHALNAIRLALGLNKDEKKFRIALFDSQSDPEMASKGVEKLINEDKAIVILGGFTAKEATSIANKAELLSVPFIGFSQKPGLTSLGEYVFRNAVTPDMQVDKLVTFAVEKLSAKKFAILYPNDSYGVEFSNIFWDHVLARGGQITAAQTYDPKTTDFSDVIQKMVGTYYEEARKDEIKQRVEELKAQAKKREKENKNKAETKPAPVRSSRDSISSENILQPVVDFDVIFVPDSSKALGQVLAFMKFNDVPDMNYLGTNLWNSTDLPVRVGNEDAGIYFSTAFDLNTPEAREGEFFKEYFATYNEEPTSVEAQVYEAAKIVKDQIGSGVGGRESLAASLRSLGTTKGVAGDIEMNSQRELVHPVHVMTLDSGLLKRAQ